MEAPTSQFPTQEEGGPTSITGFIRTKIYRGEFVSVFIIDVFGFEAL